VVRRASGRRRTHARARRPVRPPRDTGQNASGGGSDNPAGGANSGYERILLSPGIEFHLHPVSLYADVELPVFQDFRGNQLAAAALFKVILSYHF
jgi:hypothetical protein